MSQMQNQFPSKKFLITSVVPQGTTPIKVLNSIKFKAQSHSHIAVGTLGNVI